jgi:hypothetical protein
MQLAPNTLQSVHVRTVTHENQYSFRVGGRSKARIFQPLFPVMRDQCTPQLCGQGHSSISQAPSGSSITRRQRDRIPDSPHTASGTRSLSTSLRNVLLTQSTSASGQGETERGASLQTTELPQL